MEASRVVALTAALLLPSAALAGGYRVGVFLPLSGPTAEKGVPFKNAIELYAERLNAEGGIQGHKLELVFKDDGGDPEKAKQAASALVADPGVLAVIGTYYPSVAIGATKVLGDAGTVGLFPTIGSREVIDANRFMFSLNTLDEVQGGFIAVYLKEVLKKDNVLVIHNDDAFGKGLRDAFLEKANHIGLKVVQVLSVNNSAVPDDFIAHALPDPAANQKIGAVAALTHSESGLKFLPQLRDRGVGALVMGPSTWTNQRFVTEIDEKYTRDVFVTASFLYEIANARATRLVRAYQERYHALPPPNAALAYDSILLLAQALDALTDARAGKQPTRAAIRDWLAGITWQEAVDGATGGLFFKNLTAITAEYVNKYYDRVDAEAVAPGAPLPAPKVQRAAPKEHGEVRAVERDLFVSTIKDGRYKVAFTQLSQPREEYVLKELWERVKKGYVSVIDGQPFHLVDVIFTGVDIVRINDVNTRDMNWDVDVFLWFKWSGERIDPKEVDKIGVINQIKDQSSLLKESLGGPIKYRAFRKRLTLGASYDFSRFPFDRQVLPMAIAHGSRNSTHIMLVPDARHMDETPIDHINPQEWTFRRKETYADLYRYTSTFGDPDYRMGKGYKSRIYFSTVNVDVVVDRILKPYLFTFFLPLAVIMGIILLALWVPIDQFTPRINASISGLIGVLVYHMSQKNSFPKVGYTLTADYYFIVAYIVIIILMINIITVQMMVSAGHKEQARKRNRLFSVGAFLAVALIYAAMTTWSLWS
jgi:ABC-type branched-subunit amino acid transport system substrate-binding protein